MIKIKNALNNNDLEIFETECIKTYLTDKEALSLLRLIIKEKKIPFFIKAMETYLNPETFWQTSKYLVKNNQYDYLKEMIKISRDFEKDNERKNEYTNQLLFEFIEKDDLYFVSYLITKENASTQSISEIHLSVLNECAKSNAIKCFDYFVSMGKNIHEFDDAALFNALESKNNEIINIIINIDTNINEELERNLFKYNELSKKELLNLAKTVEPALMINPKIQNALNYQLIEKNMFKELEENLKKGHSPMGDDNNDLMYSAVLKPFDNEKLLKGAKLLLDFGGLLKEEHLRKLVRSQAEELENYPRFSKVKSKLEQNLAVKGKSSFNKI